MTGKIMFALVIIPLLAVVWCLCGYLCMMLIDYTISLWREIREE